MSSQTQTNSTIIHGWLLALITVNNSTDTGRSLSSISNTICSFTQCFHSHIHPKRIFKQSHNFWHKFQSELYCTHREKHVLVLWSTNTLNNDNFTKNLFIEYQWTSFFVKTFCYKNHENGRNISRFQINITIQPKLDTDPYKGWRGSLYSSTSTQWRFHPVPYPEYT